MRHATEILFMLSWQYSLFLCLDIWKKVPLGVHRWTHVLRGGKIPCLAHSVSSILKKYSIPLFSILNRVSILMHFALNGVRIERFQQHNHNQTSLITQQNQLCQLFSELKRKKEKRRRRHEHDVAKIIDILSVSLSLKVSLQMIKFFGQEK